MISGGCLCGAVRYQADAEPVSCSYCHCSQCRETSGAPVVAWVTLPRDSFNYTAGQPGTFNSSGHGCREFCRHCGSALVFSSTQETTTVDVTLCTLDDPERCQPQYHSHTGSGVSWFHVDDDLPYYEKDMHD